MTAPASGPEGERITFHRRKRYGMPLDRTLHRCNPEDCVDPVTGKVLDDYEHVEYVPLAALDAERRALWDARMMILQTFQGLRETRLALGRYLDALPEGWSDARPEES